MKSLKNKKVHIGIAVGVIVAGFVFYQGALSKDNNPKIDSISPAQGPIGTTVTINGSGFTTSLGGISGTKVKENTLAPGNYIIIKDEVINQPLVSSDGKTLTIQIPALSEKLTKECAEKFNKKKPEPCKVQIKVINAYGKPSNEEEFLITGSPIVQPPTISYMITVTQAPNGTISPGTTSVASGASQVFTLTAAPGYQVAGVILDGVDQGGSMLAQQTYTFSSVTSPYSITARFSPVMPYHMITVTQTPNGTIAPGTASIYGGNNQTYNIFPATGYKVADVIVDGVSQGAITTYTLTNIASYTFTSIASAHSITATFSLIPIAPLAPPCSLTVSIAPTTPVAQNISRNQTGVTLVKFNATPDCDGTLNSFAVALLATATLANTNNGYQNISTLRLYDDVSGVQIGTTQNVTAAGTDFTSINIPLTTNHTRVFRLVGDVSPSAVIGSTTYGVFGGSSGVTSLGGLIGNNASGNLISGNTMTVR